MIPNRLGNRRLWLDHEIERAFLPHSSNAGIWQMHKLFPIRIDVAILFSVVMRVESF
jgi:hypothetical protein